MKKLTVVGRGTVGCFTVAHFLRWTDWEIEWMSDPEIKPTAVGEGTTLKIPENLFENVNFMNSDMHEVYATPKLGIWKRGWGKTGSEFYHSFPAGRTGMHFNAVVLQEYLYNKLIKNPRVVVKESNVTSYDDLDSDFVMVCTGSPSDEDLNNYFDIRHNIPVDSCVVFQCPWNYPIFNYTATFAKSHGWVFGIPLTNRCAIGYLYNRNFATEDEVERDAQDILQQFDLIPASINKIKFNNYIRKRNYNRKVCYNGNASFFLEPLEATSTTTADDVNRMAWDMWMCNITPDDANKKYKTMMDSVESMICLHYISGSCYKNKFWDHAKKISRKKIQEQFAYKTEFYQIVKGSLESKSDLDVFYKDVGTWNIPSYKTNIESLGIRNTLIKMMN